MSDAASRNILTAISGGKSWPDDARLYQPYEVDQILMNDFANCLSVKAFLNMVGLKYQIELRNNAEHMSPSGVLPFLQIGSIIITGFDDIVTFVNLKGYSLSENLTLSEQADLKSLINFVQVILETSLLYVMWVDQTAYQMVAKVRYGFPYTWPLSSIIPWRKRKEVLLRLSLLGWKEKTLEEVHQEVTECYKALSNKLENKLFFMGDRPTELDALVFGYLYTILTTPLLDNCLAKMIGEYENLTEFCKRIHDSYFVDK